MKAITTQQPWTELILQGQETVELRTWQTNHRSRLAIHASQTVREEACIASYLHSPAFQYQVGLRQRRARWHEIDSGEEV